MSLQGASGYFGVWTSRCTVFISLPLSVAASLTYYYWPPSPTPHPTPGWLLWPPSASLSASRLAMSRRGPSPAEMSSGPVAESWCYTQVSRDAVCCVCAWIPGLVPLKWCWKQFHVNECAFAVIDWSTNGENQVYWLPHSCSVVVDIGKKLVYPVGLQLTIIFCID